MVTSTDLIECVASVTGLPRVTVGTYYRSLREAGMVSKAGRGTSAAHLTTQDAAQLLLAIGGSRTKPRPASNVVASYANAIGILEDRPLGAPVPYLSGIGQPDPNPGGELDVAGLAPLFKVKPVHVALQAILDGLICGSFSNVRSSKGKITEDFSISVEFRGYRKVIIQIKFIAFGYRWDYSGHYSYMEDYRHLSGNFLETLEDDLWDSRGFSEITLNAIADMMRDDRSGKR